MFDMIKKYLEKRCKKDEALSRHYTAAKMQECVDYINDEARKLVKEKTGTQMVQIDDNTVYNMAAHWFLESAPELEKPEIECVKAVVNGVEIVPAPNRIDLFGEA